MKQVMKTLLVLLGVLFGFAEPVFAQATATQNTIEAGETLKLTFEELIQKSKESDMFGRGRHQFSVLFPVTPLADGVLFRIKAKGKVEKRDNSDNDACEIVNNEICIKKYGKFSIDLSLDGQPTWRDFGRLFINNHARLFYGKSDEVNVGRGQASPTEIVIRFDEDLKKVVGVPSGFFSYSWWDLEVDGKKKSDVYENKNSFTLQELLDKVKQLFPNYTGNFTLHAQFTDGIDNYNPETNEVYSDSHCTVKIVDNRPVLPPPAPKHNVTLTQGVGGLIAIVGKTAQELQAIEEGTTLTVVATAAEGYELVRITAGNEDITQSGRFVVRSNTEVRAEWRKRTYSVTYTPPAGGTLRITGAANLAAVAHGTELRVEVTPEEGYELASLTAGGEDITQSRSFVVRSNTEVRAEWRKRTYSVTYTPTAGGTLRITGAANLAAVAHGTELRIEATPAEGYELMRITAGNEDITQSGRFVVRSNTEVRAEWRKRTYSVTYTPTAGGTLRITGAANLAAVAHGTELSVEATPGEGYELVRLMAGNEDITQSGRFVVRSNTEVRAEWRKRTYRVTLPSVPHARLSIKGNPDLSAVEHGTQLELEVMPDEGYLVDVVRIDGNALTAPYRFTVTGTPTIEVRIRQKVGIETVETVTLRLYPNPASTYIVVEGAAVGQWVRIYSLGGVLLQESQITEGKQRIALASLERGVYLLQVQGTTHRVVLR